MFSFSYRILPQRLTDTGLNEAVIMGLPHVIMVMAKCCPGIFISIKERMAVHRALTLMHLAPLRRTQAQWSMKLSVPSPRPWQVDRRDITAQPSLSRRWSPSIEKIPVNQLTWMINRRALPSPSLQIASSRRLRWPWAVGSSQFPPVKDSGYSVLHVI